MDYSLKEAAALLGIAPSMLRRWSEQFDILLSRSARWASRIGGSTAQRRYTEADIAILQRAKTLLSSGCTYEQVRHELAGDQVDGRLGTSAPFIVPAIPEDSAYTSAILQVAHERTYVEQDETAAVLKQKLQAQQSPINQLREHLERLSVENEVSYERGMPWSARYPLLFSYQTGMIIAACGIAALIALGIVWLDNPVSLAGADRGAIAVTASPIVAVANSPNLVPPATTSPQAPAQSPAPAQAATTTEDQLATPETSADQTPTLTAPKHALAATDLPLVTDPASAEIVLLQVAQAEAALRIGQLEATITYGSRSRSSARVRFDLGDEQRVPRFQITTTYEGTTNVQTTERIAIGDQSWQRQQDGQWIVAPARESALKQLQVFFPRIDSISNLKQVIIEGTYVLRWYDVARDSDVTLRVDPAGIPQQLRRVSRANGLVLTVTYSGWNTPVEITRPNAT